MILAASFMGWRNKSTCVECCLAMVQPAADLKRTATDRTAMNVRRQQFVLSAISPRVLQSAEDKRPGFDVIEESVEKALPESDPTASGSNMTARENPDVLETPEDRDVFETLDDPDILQTAEDRDIQDIVEYPEIHETPEELDIQETQESRDVHETLEDPVILETPEDSDIHVTPQDSDIHEMLEDRDV